MLKLSSSIPTARHTAEHPQHGNSQAARKTLPIRAGRLAQLGVHAGAARRANTGASWQCPFQHRGNGLLCFSGRAAAMQLVVRHLSSVSYNCLLGHENF